MMRFFLVSILLVTACFLKAQGDIELVVSTGFDNPTSIVFSNNHKMVGKIFLKTVSVWDVATGRMIRQVNYTADDTQIGDTLWFSPDDSKVIVASQFTVHQHHVDVRTGEVEYVEGPPIDFTKFVYHQSSLATASQFLYDPSKKQMSFPAPDGKKKLTLRKIKNRNDFSGMMPYQLEMNMEDSKGKLYPIDSGFTIYHAFSPDSKFLYLNSSVYDLETLTRVSRSEINPPMGLGIAFLPGTHIPVTCGAGTIRIWDFPTVADIKVEYLAGFKLDPTLQYLVAEQYDIKRKKKSYSVVDLVTTSVINFFDGRNEMAYMTDVDKGAERIAEMHYERDPVNPLNYSYEARILSSKGGKVLSTFKQSTTALFTPDPNIMIADSMAYHVLSYNLKSQKSSRFPDAEGATLITKHLSLDKKYFMSWRVVVDTAISSYHYNVMAWDMSTGALVYDHPIKGKGAVLDMEISNDHKYIGVTSTYNNEILIYDFATGKLVFQLEGHNGYCYDIVFSDDHKRLLSSSHDGTKRLWNLETGKEMVALISTGEKDYAIVNPQSYYYATKGAQKIIHFVRGLDIYPFEQFDLKYNRPDIILESMEASNMDLKVPLNLAYQKRLKRLGFTEDMLSGEFHLPKVSITNKGDLPILTKERTIKLNVKGIDSKYQLNRLLVRVNGVPVHGKLGVDLSDKSTQLYNDEITVNLSSGVNRISVSVMNEKGVESLASTVDIEYSDPSKRRPTLYLFSLGVSEYADKQFNLNYAAKDANDITHLYTDTNHVFKSVKVLNLKNDQVTVGVLDQIKTTLQKTTEDDVVCIFFAGHGLLDANLDYFLASYDVNFQNPSENGIPYEAFEELVDGIPARKKIIMIDACHSGEIDKEEIAWAEETTNDGQEPDEDVAFRAVTTTGFKQVGLTNSFELMKEMFADIRKSSGTLIISSAGGTEYAMEGADWNNGVFTYSLLRGIKTKAADFNRDGQVMVSEINAYVREKVVELTNGRQSPTNRAEILDFDWRMW